MLRWRATTKAAYAVHEIARKTVASVCPLLDNRLRMRTKIDEKTKFASGQSKVVRRAGVEYTSK